MAGVEVLVSTRNVKLGSQGLEVSALGLGCMGMTGSYGPAKDDAEMVQLLRHAVHMGVTFLDTADIYGPFTNEILVGKAIKGIRDKVQLATKCGFEVGPDGTLRVRGDPEHVRACCEASLERLGVDCIDLYYLHRVDPEVPIEETMKEMKKLVEEGKVKYVGLSEAPADLIRRAHVVHPITAVQTEWSLWARDVEDDVIPTCRELGIGFVPYSPLGRGFFAGAQLQSACDIRQKFIPFFKPENLEKNKKLLARVTAIAADKGCCSNQLALAWVIHKGSPMTVPIPGTTKLANLRSNAGALAVKLNLGDILALEAAVPKEEVAGARYRHVSHAEQAAFLEEARQLTASRSYN